MSRPRAISKPWSEELSDRAFVDDQPLTLKFAAVEYGLIDPASRVLKRDVFGLKRRDDFYLAPLAGRGSG
jgi:hypothetical protein